MCRFMRAHPLHLIPAGASGQCQVPKSIGVSVCNTRTVTVPVGTHGTIQIAKATGNTERFYRGQDDRKTKCQHRPR